MSIRPLHFFALASVICGILVFFLFKSYVTPGIGTDEVRPGGRGSPDITAPDFNGCAVLAFDESQDERRIRGFLERGGIEGLISESSQTVPVNDFTGLKLIPLDSFRNEIETFDPRDDGYAAKLRSFFVHDGKRLFFLPIEKISVNKAAALKKQFASLLGDIPFSLEILGHSRPVLWYFVLLAAASGGALYLSRSKRLFVLGLPVLLAFGWNGPSAFVLAAMLSGMWELLREPLRELSRSVSGFAGYAGTGSRGIRERLGPFRVNLFLALFFLIFFVVYSIALDLSLIPLAAGFVCFFFLYFLAFKAEAEKARKSEHILFAPVPLFPLKMRTFSLFHLLLPFCTGAILALFLPVVFPVLSPFRAEVSVLASDGSASFIAPEHYINTEDYNRHISFQSSFSFRSLNQNQGREAFAQEDYLSYYLGEDGLIAGGMNYSARGRTEILPETPPFPLEKLMGFLINYNKPIAGSEGGTMKEPQNVSSVLMLKECISVAIILIVCILDLFRPDIRGRKMKKVPIVRDRRIAA